MALNDTLVYIFQALVTNLITAGHGREAAFAAAVLGDNALMEKAWQDTGMLAEAVLHAHVSILLHIHPQECPHFTFVEIHGFYCLSCF